jgi:hypothetical protein
MSALGQDISRIKLPQLELVGCALWQKKFWGSVNVRFGSDADIAARPRDVRFTPESGHWLRVLGSPLCATSGYHDRSAHLNMGWLAPLSARFSLRN